MNEDKVAGCFTVLALVGVVSYILFILSIPLGIAALIYMFVIN